MDVDLDFQDRDQALNALRHIKASRIDDQKLVPHNPGIYLHSIPYDPITNLASIDYKTAEQRGYFKLDFLNVNVYKGVRDEAHLKHLMGITPLWDLLEQDDFSNLLFHINGHGNILRTMKPDTVEKLAAVLAMIRPAKRHLIGKSWDEVFAEIWIRPENGEYFFKKSHGIAYAMAIIVQMNLICEQLSYGYS